MIKIANQMEFVKLAHGTTRHQLELDILQISEYERQHIGQELHDGLGSQLSGIGMICQNLAKRLETEKHELATELFSLAEYIREVDYQARNIARGLVSLPGEPGALIHALCRLTDITQRAFGIVCTLNIVGDVATMNQMVSTHLYRIVQEAICNAVRHGNANRVYLQLTERSGLVSLTISDNGTGMPEQLSCSRGLGLRTMQYRANLIGAALSIGKGEEGGTKVVCQLLHRTEEECFS